MHPHIGEFLAAPEGEVVDEEVCLHRRRCLCAGGNRGEKESKGGDRTHRESVSGRRFLFLGAGVSPRTEAAMNQLLATVILASAIVGLSTSASNAADNSGFAVNVLVDDAPRAEYRHGGSVYIEAVRGAEYSVRLTNPMPYRVAVALSVDGLNTIDAKHTDAHSAMKWVLEPYESTVISGWQVSNRAARSFFFTGERHSYGASLGQTQNLGVIEAVFFRERRHEVRKPEVFREESSRDSAGMQAPMQAPSSSAAPSAKAQRHDVADDYAATGMGQRERHEIEMVDFELESQPVASVRLRYEFHTQLVSMGILPVHVSPLERRERASGFAYCPQQ
jgi:hypothetical protein